MFSLHIFPPALQRVDTLSCSHCTDNVRMYDRFTCDIVETLCSRLTHYMSNTRDLYVAAALEQHRLVTETGDTMGGRDAVHTT